MDEKRRYDYKSIKKTLREELDGEEFQSKAAAELFSAKQLDTENAEEFGRRLNKLRKRSQMKVDGSLLLDRYLRGIKNSIRNAVKASRPGSLREAMETAREMEQLDDLSDAVSERINQINREGDRTEIDSGTDSDIMSISQVEGRSGKGATGTSSSHPKSHDKEPNGDDVTPKGECKYCFDKGHGKNTCWRYKRSREEITCYRCNQTGHYSNKCPSQRRRGEEAATDRYTHLDRGTQSSKNQGFRSAKPNGSKAPNQ